MTVGVPEMCGTDEIALLIPQPKFCFEDVPEVVEYKHTC